MFCEEIAGTKKKITEADKIREDVVAAGGKAGKLNLTLKWEANYDYDLKLTCEHG